MGNFPYIVSSDNYNSFVLPASVTDTSAFATANIPTTGAYMIESFRRILGLTPKQLIMRFRVEEALRLLETTDRPLSEIAPLCGYYDQSAFTRHFRRVVGFGPAGWRDHRALPSNE